MKPILFNGTETAFTSNGLGRIDPISCTVTEERNGQYELEMVVSMEDRHYADIQEGRLLLSRHDETSDLQPFEIYYISRPLNGQVTVLAHHISYRSAKITVSPFSASGIVDAMEKMRHNWVGEQPFTLWTNKSTQGAFKVSKPIDLRSLLGGSSGSLLDVYGTGEYEWDKFNIKLHLLRGVDSGVVLRYGKDITELKKTTDASNLWTGVVPFWHKEEETGDILVMLPELAIMSATASTYDYNMIVPLDLSSAFENQPTVEQLREKAERYVTANALTAIPATIDVSFINLASLEEYRNVAPLQRLRLCDTLTILHTRLGVSSTAKIIKIVFDVLTEKYFSMTVGEAGTNLDSTMTGDLRDSIEDLRTTTALNLRRTRREMEQETQQLVEDQTSMITGGSGGYVVLKIDADGKTREILIMNTDDMDTATQVLRINMNGIGFSSHGINGPYESAWTLDGRFNASFIQTGILNASLIRAGIITDLNETNYWNLDTGEFRLAATTTVGGSTVSDIASSAVSTYDTSLNQQAVFNKLTNNGVTQGIYLSNGKLYINASYIGTGTLDATLIRAGSIRDTANKNYWNLDTGEFSLSASATVGGSTVSSIASSAASSAVSTYDTGLNQQAVFNKLTNNGVTQGIYLSNNKLYINAAYIKTGIISDSANKNYWNLATGEFSLSASATVGGSTVSSIASSAASSAVNTYDSGLNQQAVFNKLTNNGATQGIYLSNNKLYINASYIAAGIISDSQNKNSWNLSTGALTMSSGSININNGSFKVDNEGNLTASSASINGTIKSSSNSYQTIFEEAKIQFKYNNSSSGYVNGDEYGGVSIVNGSGKFISINPHGIYLVAPNLLVQQAWDDLPAYGYTGSIDGTAYINGICVGYG